MRIILFGDVVGRSGREVLFKNIDHIKQTYHPDFMLADVDNVTHGFGISETMMAEFFSMGFDVLTGGNHLFDQKDALKMLSMEKRLLRPDNMPSSLPGSGICESIIGDNKKIVTIHLTGCKNMPILGDNPFLWMDKILQKYKLGENANAIIIDFHAETTSEKCALGHYLDGRVSIVVGTHTHVPTADHRILINGTAYQTDLGMCGNYDSVLGMEKQACIERFTKGYNTARLSAVYGNGTLFFLIVDLDDTTGLAKKISFERLD